MHPLICAQHAEVCCASLVTDLPNARVADFSSNKLRSVPPALGMLVGLQSLRLSDNLLTDAGIPWRSMSTLASLTQMILDNNSLEHLPAAISHLTALVRLSVDHNHLSGIADEGVSSLAALQVLSLNNNRLAALPSSLGKASS